MQTTQTTQTGPAKRGLSDRTINRLIIGIIVVLVILVPLVGVIYFLDRSADPGPSMAQRAATAAEDAVRQQPNNVAARMTLAASYAAEKRFTDAIAQYTEILRVVPDDHGALLARGNTYLAVKDDASATKDFQHLVDLTKTGEMANADPQLEEAYFRLGDIALRAGQTDVAIKNLSAALSITRTDADALSDLGAAYVKAGRAKDAVNVLDAAIALVPTGWCDPYQNLQGAYTALKNTDGVAYTNGMVAFCGGQTDAAVAALTPLSTGSGDFAVLSALGLGQIAEQKGDAATATRMYLQVLSKDPQNFNATAGLQRLGTAPSAAPGSSTAPAASATTGVNP